MQEEIEKVFKKHEQIAKGSWILIIVLLFLFADNKSTNLEKLDNLLTRLEKGDTNFLKEEIKDE